MGYDADVERRSPLCLIDVRGAAGPVAELLSAAGLTPSMVPNVAAGKSATLVARLGPRQWIVIAPIGREAELVETFEQSAADASAVLVSDAFAVFSVSGLEAADIIAQATPLDVHPTKFPEDGATFTAFFGLTALVVRRGDAFECLVDAGHEDYVADRLSRCHARPGPWFREYRAGRA